MDTQVHISIHQYKLVYASIHGCIQVYISMHRYTHVYTSKHRHTQVYISIHRYTSVYAGVHRYTSGMHQYKQNFAKVSLAKSFWWQVCLNFLQPNICAIRLQLLQIAIICVLAWRLQNFVPILKISLYLKGFLASITTWLKEITYHHYCTWHNLFNRNYLYFKPNVNAFVRRLWNIVAAIQNLIPGGYYDILRFRKFFVCVCVCMYTYYLNGFTIL